MELSALSVTKTFGEKIVLDNINLTARAGQALGLLGPNGAGKTTLIRIIMGVFPPDSGRIEVDNKQISRSSVKFGYLPEERGLYPKHKILDQMIYFGTLRGLSRKTAEKQAKYWLERFEMGQYQNSPLLTLSKGNQQKIQLAVTLICDPDIIILDEPFSGLDPVNAGLLKEIVVEQVKSGKIVIFSSHQMSYVEEFCDNILLINKGRMVLEGNLRQIKRSYARNRIMIGFENADAYGELTSLKNSGGLGNIVKNIEKQDDGAVVTLENEADRNQLLASLINLGHSIEAFYVKEPSLEQIFVERVGEGYEQQ
ncbi:MAG TPA: ATP-binding cassette domain-containing protein [Clostridiales bacterium]|nr:ATP-binding cassette domain-containing protein [Clostridiales bacterium]